MTENSDKQSYLTSLTSCPRLATASGRTQGLKRSSLFSLLPGLVALLFASFISVQFISPVFSAERTENTPDGEESIAVFDFESERGLYGNAAIFMTDGVRREIVKKGKYTLLERGDMDSLLSKHSFIMTSDMTVEYAVEAARALKVRTAIIGYVSKKDALFFLRLSRINADTGAVEYVVEDTCSDDKKAMAQLSKTIAAKLLGDVKVAFLRPALPKNKRFIVNALSIFDTVAKLEWMRDADSAARTMTWTEANKYVGQLNSRLHAGNSDWRLPEKDELAAIIEYANNEGVKINLNELYAKIGFKNLKAEYYWSASSADDLTGLAWVIDLYGGKLSTAGKSGGFYVWPVRSVR